MSTEPKIEDSKFTALTIEVSEKSETSRKSPAHSPRLTRSVSKNMSESELNLNTLFKFIKPYDGSRETVNSFIINCNNACGLASETQKPILFKYILSQLSGKAELACSIKEFTSWEQLKEFLKTNFSERKHYAHLLTDLQESKQGPQDNVSQFSLRVESYLSQLLTEITLSNTKQKELPGRCAAMEDLALHHFLMGLQPRISNIVRCRSPKSLNEAINMAISEERIQQSLYKRPPTDNKFVAKSKPQPGPSRNAPSTSGSSNVNQSKTGSDTPFCRYCKTSGHDIKDCKKREFYNNKYPSKQNPQQGTNSGSRKVNHIRETSDEETADPTDDDDLNETTSRDGAARDDQ